METLESTINIDCKIEREVAEFLNEHLYSDKTIFKAFKRTDNREEQLQGSDIIVSTTDGKLNNAIVDEKVAAKYANQELKTFAFEISFIGRDGKEIVGWFIDEQKTTEYYLCGWVTKSVIEYDNEHDIFKTEELTKDKIRSIDWCLVSREKIISYLKEKGWTFDKIKRQANKIRKNEKVKRYKPIDGISFRYGNKLFEKPVNLLIWKYTLMEQLADYKGTIKVK